MVPARVADRLVDPDAQAHAAAAAGLVRGQAVKYAGVTAVDIHSAPVAHWC
jgi:hypothetical protein